MTLGKEQIKDTVRKTWSKDEAKNVIVKCSYKPQEKNQMHCMSRRNSQNENFSI